MLTDELLEALLLLLGHDVWLIVLVSCLTMLSGKRIEK